MDLGELQQGPVEDCVYGSVYTSMYAESNGIVEAPGMFGFRMTACIVSSRLRRLQASTHPIQYNTMQCNRVHAIHSFNTSTRKEECQKIGKEMSVTGNRRYLQLSSCCSEHATVDPGLCRRARGQ